MYKARNTETGKEYEGRTVADLVKATGEIDHIMSHDYNPKPSTIIRQMIEDGVIEQLSGPDWYMDIEFGRSAGSYAEIAAEEEASYTNDEESPDNAKVRIIQAAAEKWGLDYDKLWQAVENSLEHDIFPQFSSPERRAEYIQMISEIEELGTTPASRLFAW